MTKSENIAVSNEDELKSIFSNSSGNKEKDLKANTMLEKMGFRDEDLTSKTHDDIFIELMNKDNIINIGLLMNKDINKKMITITPEYPITTDRNFVIGFVDMLVIIKYGNDDYERICIEIKTKIENNIGAIIRQINMYKLHIRNSDFVIIAPEITKKQKEIFKESGICSMSMKEISTLSSRHLSPHPIIQ